ncbi:MAG: AraC family transcriptional regulator ligand-binding domain-containing protein [Hyphomicrobiaceae bacterium]
MQEPILSASFLTTLGDYLRAQGQQPSDTFRRAGFAYEWLQEEGRPQPLNAVAELFELAARDTGDKYFGLNYAVWLDVGHFGMLDHLMMSAGNVREALRLAAKFGEATISGIRMNCHMAGPTMALVGRLPSGLTAPSAQFVDFLMAVLVQRIRLAVGADWRPVEVSLPRREPDEPGRYVKQFGPRLNFATVEFRLSVSREELKKPMPGGWPGLSQTIVAAAEQALSELRISDNYADFVRLHVADRLAKEEDVRLDAVARSLDLSSRALQWRLGQSDANYEALLREVRTTTAISLLRDTALTMNEVGRRLGFSEGSAFTRWSRQHFSMTPSAYRRSLRTQA